MAAAKQEWLIIIPDHANMLAKRMEVRPQHLEILGPNVEKGAVTFGGATLDEPLKEGQGPKANGSAMVVVADTREEAMNIVQGDVYVESGVWDMSKAQVFPFKCAVRTAI